MISYLDNVSIEDIGLSNIKYLGEIKNFKMMHFDNGYSIHRAEYWSAFLDDIDCYHVRVHGQCQCDKHGFYIDVLYKKSLWNDIGFNLWNHLKEQAEELFKSHYVK